MEEKKRWQKFIDYVIPYWDIEDSLKVCYMIVLLSVSFLLIKIALSY